MKKEVVLCDVCQSVIGPDNRSKFEPVPCVMKGGLVVRFSVVIDSPQPVDICWSCIKRIMKWETVGELE